MTAMSDAERPSGQRMVETASREGWTLHRLEKEYILKVLRQTGGHRGRAAAILGIDRRTLYRKLQQYAKDGHRIPGPTRD